MATKMLEAINDFNASVMIGFGIMEGMRQSTEHFRKIMLDRDVPRVNAMLKRMTEHLEAYLRGGDESDRLLEILGTSSNMRRGGDVDETGAAHDSATESGEQTPPEGTQ